MPAYRYTPTSAQARAVGQELLRLSRIYEDPVLPHGYGAGRMAVVAAVVRARRLLTAATALADRGDGLEAALLTRAILELAFTLGWLKREPQLGLLIWMLDDQRSTLNQHEEVRRHERSRRRRARISGEQLVPVAASATLGLLDDSSLYRHRKAVRELEAQIRALPQLKRRLRRLRPMTYPPRAPVRTTLINRMPNFDERAKVAGILDLYALIYRFDSRAAAHPNPLSVEQFLEARPEGVVVHAEPQHRRPDPYGVGAAVLGSTSAERTMRHRQMRRPPSPGFHYGGVAAASTASRAPFGRERRTDPSPHGLIPLFKLHGSLNWALRGSTIEVFPDPRPAFRARGSAAIVPPLPEKQAPTWLRPVWEGAEVGLAEADVWVVVGYSLPPYDEAARDLLMRSARAGNVRRIDLFDPSAAELASRWASLAGPLEVRPRGGLPRG